MSNFWRSTRVAGARAPGVGGDMVILRRAAGVTRRAQQWTGYDLGRSYTPTPSKKNEISGDCGEIMLPKRRFCRKWLLRDTQVAAPGVSGPPDGPNTTLGHRGPGGSPPGAPSGLPRPRSHAPRHPSSGPPAGHADADLGDLVGGVDLAHLGCAELLRRVRHAGGAGTCSCGRRPVVGGP